MKRIICFLLCLFLLSGCAAADTQSPAATNPGTQFVGKTLDDLEASIVPLRLAQANGYYFGTVTNGDLVVIQYDSSNVVTSAQILPAKDTSNTPETFAELKAGMTIYEVIAKVGLPCDCAVLTGLFAHSFVDSSGAEYKLVWDSSKSTAVLASVAKIG